jgi:hypothetical protein
LIIADVLMRAVITKSQPAANATRGFTVRKLLFKSFQQRVVAETGRIKRRKMRSCPRLERLEGRIVMSTFQVNTTLDTAAVNLRTGKDATGHISLRSAIMAANARGGSNTIKLRNGTYSRARCCRLIMRSPGRAGTEVSAGPQMAE